MAKSFAAWLSQRKQVKPGSDAMQSNDMHLVRPFDIDIDVRTYFRLAPELAVTQTRYLVLRTIPTIKCVCKMTSLSVQLPLECYRQALGFLRSNPMFASTADSPPGADAASTSSAASAAASTAPDKSAAVASVDLTDSISWDVDFSVKDFQFDLLASGCHKSFPAKTVVLHLQMDNLQSRVQVAAQMRQVRLCVDGDMVGEYGK